jgi:Beta-propeller repeat/Bacterial Ig domain
MFHSKKFQLLSIFIVSILLPVCLIAWQHIPRQVGLKRHAQMQSESAGSRAGLFAPTGGTIPAEDRRRIKADYGRLPLSFEPNRGQTDPRVKFLSRAGKRTLWLTNDEAVLAVGRPSRSNRVGAKQADVRDEYKVRPAVLRMKFMGASVNPSVAGEVRQQGTVNYFTGKPEQWRTKIPVYSRVRYSSLYPGIDLVFYGTNSELEYDLVVSPGSDPEQIKLGISGAENMRIDGDGNLVLKTAAGDVIQQKPRIYQRKGASLVFVAGNYVINGKNEVGFRLGNYDHEAAVVIDPVLRYASYLTGGGDEDDGGTGIAVDSSNRVVVAGWTCSGSFPGENGPAVPRCVSAFVTKLDFTGSSMIFTAFVPGSVFFDNVPLALDAANNIYIAGSTNGNTFGDDTFEPTAGAFQVTFGGKTDAWVAKLNSSGTNLIYATFLGGSGNDRTGGIAVDSSGNAYVTGTTTSKNFPVTAGVFQRECKLKNDGSCASAFVAKLNALGTRVLYSSYLGGHGTQSGEGVALNPSGNAFVVGATDAKDFPTMAGSAQPVPAGAQDAFVAQVSSSGSHLNYSTFLGGSGADAGNAIALDSFGNAFVTGRTQSANFPVKNAFQSGCSGACGFVSKLNTSGRLVYSTFLGSGGGSGFGSAAGGTGIAVTSAGEAYIAGEPGPNFPITQNVFQRVQGPQGLGNGPGGSIFITKFSATGQLIYSSYFGGGLNAPRVALDRSTNAYLTGLVSFGGLVPATPGAFQEQRGAEEDSFVAKVVALCALSTANRSVTICSPASGSTVASPVRIIAGTTDVTPVKLTQVYLDGKKIFQAPLSAINVGLPIAAGTHRLTVQGLDTAGVFFKKTIFINVSSH